MRLETPALVATVGLAVALAAGPAQAVITEPIPDIPTAGPPPIPALPAAGESAPPAGSIRDPMEPNANCSGWYSQSSYAGLWPTGWTWWEYECSLDEAQFPDCGPTPGVMCTLGGTVIDYPWGDRFYWDGTQPVFLGENYQTSCDYWWDPPTAQWYVFVTDGCPPEPSPPPPPPPPPPPNAAPTAGFGVSCAALRCDLDAGASSDADGTVVQYQWEFGDGSTATGRTAQHSYAQPGSYTIKLTVTDDDGATGSASKTLTPIAGLTARGYKLKGLQRVDLSWSGSSAADYDVLRDDTRIATVAGASYTDSPGRKGPGSYRYQVCVAGSQICSSQATVNF